MSGARSFPRICSKKTFLTLLWDWGYFLELRGSLTPLLSLPEYEFVDSKQVQDLDFETHGPNENETKWRRPPVPGMGQVSEEASTSCSTVSLHIWKSTGASQACSRLRGRMELSWLRNEGTRAQEGQAYKGRILSDTEVVCFQFSMIIFQ